MIQIYVVSEMEELARKLVHSLSKFENTKSSYYTINKWKDNEHSISTDNYVIFLGDNELTDNYKDIIEPKFNKCGVIWGYDNKKAYIRKVHSSLNEKEVSKIYRYLKIAKKDRKEQQNAGEIGGLIGGTAAAAFFFPTVPFTVLLGIPGIILFKKFRFKKHISPLQYNFGIMTFLKEGFDNYLKD